MRAPGSEIRFVSICGMLGYGYPIASLDAGMAFAPTFLGADNGSTDPGPYYLGSGKGFVKPRQIERDLEPALCASVAAGVPLIIGSAGGSGAAPHVETFLAVLRAIAARRNLHFKAGRDSRRCGEGRRAGRIAGWPRRGHAGRRAT